MHGTAVRDVLAMCPPPQHGWYHATLDVGHSINVGFGSCNQEALDEETGRLMQVSVARHTLTPWPYVMPPLNRPPLWKAEALRRGWRPAPPQATGVSSSGLLPPDGVAVAADGTTSGNTLPVEDDPWAHARAAVRAEALKVRCCGAGAAAAIGSLPKNTAQPAPSRPQVIKAQPELFAHIDNHVQAHYMSNLPASEATTPHAVRSLTRLHTPPLPSPRHRSR